MAQKIPSVLITGANRGLGLGFVKEYLRREWIVFAGCREPSEELVELREKHSTLTILEMSVTDPLSIDKAFESISRKNGWIDILINNAGRMGKTYSNIAEYEDFEDGTLTLQTNVLGPMWVAKSAIPLLKLGYNPRIIQITSGLGSISENHDGDYHIYRISKAGLNMLNKTLSVELRPSGITCVGICPGWVNTDMGGSEAPLHVDQSIKAMVQTIDTLSLENTGSYIQRHGEKHPF